MAQVPVRCCVRCGGIMGTTDKKVSGRYVVTKGEHSNRDHCIEHLNKKLNQVIMDLHSRVSVLVSEQYDYIVSKQTEKD